MVPNLICACAVLASCSSHAQSPPDRRTIFSGRNVYSPSLDFDAITGTFKMWYGGWQSQADYPHDKIYYRESTDGVTWSAPQTVLTPAQMPVAATHVNDPAVVTSSDARTGKLQYTMFYTVCVAPCTANSDNQLWSSVSKDGLHWSVHKPLIQTGGAAVPTAVPLKPGGRAIWRVYYSNTSERNNSPTNVFMADVDDNRNVVTEDAVAYAYPGPGVIANPEVRQINGVWDLFFNVYYTRPGATRNTADIYLAQSESPAHWRSGSERPVIVNDPGGDVCATVAPAVLAYRGRLLLQFGVARYSRSGTCDFSEFQEMDELDADISSLSGNQAAAASRAARRDFGGFAFLGAGSGSKLRVKALLSSPTRPTP